MQIREAAADGRNEDQKFNRELREENLRSKRVMVTKTEESQLEKLESQVDNGGGGAWEYLCLVRKLKVRRSDKVLKYGLSILNDSRKRSSLGPDGACLYRFPFPISQLSSGFDLNFLEVDLVENWMRNKFMSWLGKWTLYEQVAIAAMDSHALDVAKDCITVLQKKFPESKRVGRLEGMLLEAKGSWEEAENAYSSLLEDNPLDQIIHKRRIAVAKAQGNISTAIDLLNKYLEIFMADHDAWRELAEIYVSLQMYKQAAFCYEELILSQPTVPLHHLAYADVLYTLGGLENIQNAKKYYSSTVDLTGGKNNRALFGICLCTSAISQLSRGRNKDDKDTLELPSLATAALEKEYKQNASDKLSVLTSALKCLRVS
ncbi:ER membrane protein complex subunit 2 [Linum perenne]